MDGYTYTYTYIYIYTWIDVLVHLCVCLGACLTGSAIFRRKKSDWSTGSWSYDSPPNPKPLQLGSFKGFHLSYHNRDL